MRNGLKLTTTLAVGYVKDVLFDRWHTVVPTVQKITKTSYNHLQ